MNEEYGGLVGKVLDLRSKARWKHCEGSKALYHVRCTGSTKENRKSSPHDSRWRTTVLEQRSHRVLVAADECTE